MKKLLKTLSLLPDKQDFKAFFISFALINFAFLHHTASYLWGNHDVKFIRNRLFLDSGFFEGRFTQFITQNFLLMGQILPILNNLISFFAFTLGLWLLAKYWNIKKTTLNYVLFISFLGTEPYTLSWLYFSLQTISCLQWVFFAVLGLYLSALIYQSKYKFLLSFCAILCFYLPLGGYPPIINTFGVGLCGKLAVSYLIEHKTLKELGAIHKYTIANIIIACLLFKLSLHFIPVDNIYNLKTTDLSQLTAKLVSALWFSLNQFSVTLPFMEYKYKLILAAMSVTSVICALLTSASAKRAGITVFFIICTICASQTTTFLAVSPTEFVPRIDFYGTGFVYGFFLAFLLTIGAKITESLALLFALILIPVNIINDYRAQWVWKQGFDSELEILEKVVERIENLPEFVPHKSYRLYVAGDIIMRPQFYTGTFRHSDPFLLSYPYLAMWQGANLVEFFPSSVNINHDTPLLPTDITPEVYDFYTTQARPWPHPTSVRIINDVIIIIYNNYGLEDFKHKLRQVRQLSPD